MARFRIMQDTVLLFLVFIAFVCSESTDIQEYCQWEVFNATCEENEVLLMTSAKYGRMQFGRCMKEDHGNRGCHADVLLHLDRKCSGFRSCEMPVHDAGLHKIHPCPKELVPYLEASYDCLKVQSGDSSSCLRSREHPVEGPSGYLASITTLDGSIGTAACPWVIQVENGKNINITLIHFDVSKNTAKKTLTAGECSIYMVVQEDKETREIPICGIRTRQKPLYLSVSNRIKIYLRNRHFASATPPSRFLLKYEAVGCSDVIQVENAWIIREGDTTVVKCNFTGETYFLSCDESRWMGEIANCTKVTTVGAVRGISIIPNFPYGLLIVIGIGVALGVALGIIMLFGILICLRKRKEQEKRSATRDLLLGDITNQDSDDPNTCLYDKRINLSQGPSTLNRLNRMKPDLYADAMTAAQYITTPIAMSEIGEEELPVVFAHADNVDIRQKRLPASGADMQTCFVTFKPDASPGRPDHEIRQTQKEANIDLVMESQQRYNKLNPDTLVMECSCTLKQGQNTLPCWQERKENHYNSNADNKSV